MAVLSKLPTAPPPAAPAREKTRHLLLRGWCVFVLFLALSGVSLVNALGTDGAVMLTIASAVVSAAVWALVRPPMHWRRIPWFPVAYIVWAAASILWSQWTTTSLLTWALLAITTFQGMFTAAMLTWRELIRAIGTALKWCLGLSLVFEFVVAVFLRGPILPGFVRPEGSMDPIVYWCRANLIRGGRIQGIFGSSNLLAAVCLIALIVFALRLVTHAAGRISLTVWIIIAAYLMYRAASATITVAAVVTVLVLGATLLMRTAHSPGARTRRYVLYVLVALLGAGSAWLLRDPLFAALGRSSDLTGRLDIWGAVLERTAQRPVTGWGFATPWIPSDPHFDGWIIDHGQTVMQAHNAWVDVSMQLGIVGVVLLGLMYLAFLWRSWFFAVDRPRFDLRADRPYSPLSLLPTLVATVLLVQSLAESEPLLLWGWMFVVMLALKIKQSPHIGAGTIEQRLAIERGDVVNPLEDAPQ